MLVRFPAVVVLRLLYRSRAARRTTVRPSYQIAMKREGKYGSGTAALRAPARKQPPRLAQ
ncbi:hypothetical protein GPA_17230 [Gordonibacter pamelaeae 7-10-1-b]|uniref:Uncharacterized protein n=1 Tax=Gordonibacter pamelaeae 7-10-1-b TaxID=657308 RepID=D6E908_9ACTN|nr:hypothetical protein GPA_17230 [Gordonibacter pamelaeae 7-10-1-b]